MKSMFRKVKKMFQAVHNDETGQGMTEYIIIVVLIAIAVIIVVSVFGKRIKSMFGESTEELESIEVAPTEDY